MNPREKSLDKYWIDANFSYLVKSVGLSPPFEPSESFYKGLGGLTKTGVRQEIACKNSLSLLFDHLRLPDVPVFFAANLKNCGEFQYSPGTTPSHPIVPGVIRISDRYTTIEDLQVRGMAVGAVVSHEISHYYLMSKGIRRETVDNERLTDLVMFVLGLGKLHFNGGNIVIEGREEHLGYLPIKDTVYAFMEYQKHAGIPIPQQTTNLSGEAHQIITFWQGSITRELEEFLRRDSMGQKEEDLEDLRATGTIIDSRIRHALSGIKKVEASVSSALHDQAIIDRTSAFWNISRQDHRVMEEFNARQKAGAFEQEVVRITGYLHGTGQALNRINQEIASGKLMGQDKLMKDLKGACAGQEERIGGLAREISSVQDAHKRCFNQMDAILPILEEMKKKIQECRTLIGDIRTLHRFLLDNPSVWHQYTGELAGTIENTITSPQQEQYFRQVEQYVTDTRAFLLTPRKQYPGVLNNSPDITRIAAAARSQLEGVLETGQRLRSLLGSQRAIINEYSEEASLIINHLHSLQAVGIQDRQDIRDLMLRQEVIFANLRGMKVPADDVRVFDEIIKAVCTCSPEAELAHYNRVLLDIGTAIQRDAGRVAHCMESESITPREVHEKEYRRMAEELQASRSRIARWKEMQLKYIGLIEERKQRSPREVLKRLKKSIQTGFKKPGS